MNTTRDEKSFKAALKLVQETKARWAAEKADPSLAAARVAAECATLARIARED